MSVTEEIQVAELKLLQEYVDIIMNVLEAILNDKPTSYEYLTELSQRITTQLQEQYSMWGKEVKFILPCLWVYL